MRPLLALLLVAPLAASQGPGELLDNGGFGAWALQGGLPCPAMWQCSAPPVPGAVLPWAKYVSAPAAAMLAELGWLEQDAPAEPGLIYALSVWYQHPQAGCMAVVRLLFFDTEGNFLERPTDHVVEQVVEWRELVLAARAPEGTASVTVHLAGGCLHNPPGVFLVDNASLRAG